MITPPTPNEPHNNVTDPIDLEERIAFLNLGADDAQRLRDFASGIESFGKEFVEKFYRHLFSFDVTARLLRDPERLARLKELQLDYFVSMFEAIWDDDYVDVRQRVGRVHAEVELEPHIFLGAYVQYIESCLRHLVADRSPETLDCIEQILSIIKVVFLDVGLTLDSYFFQSTLKLRQALDMYWKANHDLRQFAHLTSHDLKTPIATVANLCEEMLDEFSDSIPEEAAQLIANARGRTFQISRMIDELLEATLAFQSDDATDEVSSDAIVREAVDRLRPELDQREIEVRLPSNFPYIWGNKVRLREAFYNLISNAAKFIDKRPGLIKITVEVEENRATFVVADNGPGIPVDELTKVFAPFRRLREHTNHPGSGLGLYFTKHLIEEEGGRVWAESEPGKGSRFFVSLKRGPGV